MVACCGGSKVKTDKFSTFADAAYNGNVEKMKERLKVEAKNKNFEAVLNKRDESDNHLAPLHKAAQKGKCDAIRFLIDNNADPRILSKNGETPLHIACFHRNTDAVIELLKSAAKQDVNTKEKVMGMTPLHIAVWKGCPEIVDLLIKSGGDPSIKDKNGHDCFEQAVFWSKQENEGMGSPQARHNQTLSLLQGSSHS